MPKKIDKTLIEKPEEPEKSIGRRERRRNETREKVFRTALRLFAERGFMATTIDAITAEADIGKGTFFSYFDNKESILMQFREMQMGRVRAFVTENINSDEPLPKLINRLALVMTQEQQESPSLFHSMMAAIFLNEEMRGQLADGLISGRKMLAELIEKRQRSREIRSDIPADEIAYSLQRMIFGSMLLWSISPSNTLKKQLRDAVDVFVNGIKKGAKQA